MEDWGEPIVEFLDGDTVSSPSDFAVKMGSESSLWHPQQTEPPSKEECVDRDYLGKSERTLIANVFENLAAEDYRGWNIGDGKDSEGEADVVVGLNDRAYGVPIQVKSCIMHMKNGRPGSFKFRWKNYNNLPENSFIDFYMYSVETDGEPIREVPIKKLSEGDYSGEPPNIEIYGRMLVPKNLLESTFPDIAVEPGEEDSGWYANGIYALRWDNLFEEKMYQCPVYQQIREVNSEGDHTDHDLEIFN